MTQTGEQGGWRLSFRFGALQLDLPTGATDRVEARALLNAVRAGIAVDLQRPRSTEDETPAKQRMVAIRESGNSLVVLSNRLGLGFWGDHAPNADFIVVWRTNLAEEGDLR